MSDLCAPLYVAFNGNEEMTFWCFVQYMNKMVGKLVLLHPDVVADCSDRKRTSYATKVE